MSADLKPPLISVIAVSYNHERWILETLESIKRQTLQDFELIFCDDASQDRSVELATRWLEEHRITAQLILHKQNQGLCRTLNEAILRCHGKYIQSIACDDNLRPDKLARQSSHLENAAGEVGMVCSNFAEIDARGQVTRPQYFPSNFEFPASPFEAVLTARNGEGITIHSPTALVRKCVFDVVGGYDEAIVQEDFDMWLRVSRRFQVDYLPDVLVDYRVLPTSLSRVASRRLVLLLDHLHVLAKLAGDPIASNQLPERLVRCLEELAKHPLNEADLSRIERSLQRAFASEPELAARTSVLGLRVANAKPVSTCRRAISWLRRLSRSVVGRNSA